VVKTSDKIAAPTRDKTAVKTSDKTAALTKYNVRLEVAMPIPSVILSRGGGGKLRLSEVSRRIDSVLLGYSWLDGDKLRLSCAEILSSESEVEKNVLHTKWMIEM
jgi:hypothetical protein